VVLAAAILSATGCGGPGVLRDLPDPLFRAEQARAKRPRIPPRRPRPAPVRPVPAPPAHPEWCPPGGIRDRWECIVIHHSATHAGGAHTFDLAHRNRGWDELGYHFVIGNGTDTADGAVEVGSRWMRQKHGAHCKTPDGFYNQQGIGICLVGNLEEHRPTARQMASLVELIRFLTESCEIPLGQVLTHRGVTGRTLCPGKHFPFAELKARLALTTAAGGLD